MSKYDQNIKEFLLKYKEVSVEKIGLFTFNRPGGDEKILQTQFIDFKFNKKAQTSEDLIDFIVKETGKNKTLISSDLASLFEEARQYINIGKAFSIAGLGMLSLNRAGEYAFTPAQGNVPASDAAGNNAFKANAQAPGKKQTRQNAVIFFAFLIILLIAAGLAWVIYKNVKQQKGETVLTETDGTTGDSAAAQQNKAPALQIGAGDSTYYKFIFETTLSRYRANNRYDSLKSWGEHIFIDSIKSDSVVVYHLFVKARLVAKDTAHVKDSVQRYFQRPVKIASN